MERFFAKMNSNLITNLRAQRLISTESSVQCAIRGFHRYPRNKCFQTTHHPHKALEVISERFEPRPEHTVAYHTLARVGRRRFDVTRIGED